MIKLQRAFGFLAASALLAATATASAATVTAKSDLGIARPSETIEVPWAEVVKTVPGAKADGVKVTDSAGKPVVSQALDVNADGTPELLLFQSDFAANESKSFKLEPGTPTTQPSKVFGRFVPERYDDFAWESDKVGFRIYGKALESVPRETGGSGIDVRSKRGGGLVIDDWYKNHYKTGGAHKDVAGNGADFYKVGLLRGCGGTGIWKDSKIHYPMGYRKYNVVANGPVRFVADFTYETFDAGGGVKLGETKRIMIDGGSSLNHMQSTYTVESGSETELPVVVGVQKHKLGGEAKVNKEQGWVRFWDPADPQPNGNIGAAALMRPKDVVEAKEIEDHVILLTHATPGQPVDHWAGSGWDQSADFPNVAAWDAYLESTSKRIASPLKVTVGQ